VFAREFPPEELEALDSLSAIVFAVPFKSFDTSL
jgi:hypothetical protein